MSGKRIPGDSSTIPHNPAGVEKQTPRVEGKESTATSVGQDISFREHDTRGHVSGAVSDTASGGHFIGESEGNRKKKTYHTDNSGGYKGADAKYRETAVFAQHANPPHTTGYKHGDNEAADTQSHQSETNALHSGSPHTGSTKAELQMREDGIPCIYWPDSYKGGHQKGSSHQVPFITKEFILFCPEKVVSAQIKLFGLNIEMKPSKSLDSVYESKVSIQGDYPSGHQYFYDMVLCGRLFGTSNKKSKNKLDLDSGETHRDIWDIVTSEGILAHGDHIEQSKLNWPETYSQMTILLSTYIKDTGKKQLFLDISSELESRFKENNSIRTVDICFWIHAATQYDLNQLLSKMTANHLLSSLEKLQLCGLPGPGVSRLLTDLCDITFANDSKVMSHLYFSYSCLGEQTLYDEIKSTDTIRNIVDNKVNEEYVVRLFLKVYKAGSFQSDLSQKIISKIINDVPFDLCIRIYASLVARDDKEKSYTIFKESVRNETLKKAEEKLKVLEKDKLASCLSIWGTIYQTGKACMPFRKMFENHLVKLMAFSSVQNAKEIVQVATQRILFESSESKMALLKAIASSPDYMTAELFIQLTSVGGFDKVYSDLDTSVFQQWFYNSPDTSKRNKSRSITVIVKRLLFIVTLPKVLGNQEIVDTIESILFDELKKLSIEKVLKSAVAFADASKDNSLLIKCFLDYLSGKLQTVTIDIAKLFGPFLYDGVVQMKTRLIADISCLIIGKYGKTEASLSPTDQFFKAVDQRQLWGFAFAAKGSYKAIVENHPFYRTASNYIKMTAERLSNLEIDFKLMKRITSRKEDVTGLLSLFRKKYEIKKLLQWNAETLATEDKKLTAVKSVLLSVKKQSIELPDGFDEFVTEIEKKLETFYEGNINGKDCQLLWKRMAKIPEYCRYLETVIQSVVYWNMVRDKLTDVKNESNTENELKLEEGHNLASKENTNSDKEHISDDREISGKDNDQEGLAETDITWKTSIEYIKKLRYGCFENYAHNMEKLLKTNDIRMSQIIHMFDCKAVINPASKPGPDLDMEKKVVEKVLPDLHGTFVWDTLQQVYNIAKIKTKVEEMRSFLSVIRIDFNSDQEFESALVSFEQLLRDNVNDYTFLKVRTALGTIYSITNVLSDETFDIMGAIGKCSSLIDFLKETVDEDIRNLIDAVEDISEQQVRESTVSGLIEIKQLLHPVLKHGSDFSCQKLLNIFNSQVKKVKKVTSIPAKIHDCMNNLHNLKSLYNNVANRGEQTKQIVKNIIEFGVFQFKLNKKLGSVLVEASYNQNDKLVVKRMSELSDLRSRSLLLMNNESNTSSNLNREQVKMFKRYVDRCVEVADLCTLLHTSGHFLYIDINNKEFPPSALAKECESLSKELEDWQKNLSDERKKHYLMNYINGFGLQSMYQYLNLCEKMSGRDKENVEDTAKTILVFIHPDMKAEQLRKQYITEKVKCKTWTMKDWLNCLGGALHSAYPDSSTFSQNFTLQEKEKMDSLKMTDVVQEGKLFVAQLDEHSAYTVRTVLALYANTTNRMPEPHEILFCTQETSLDEIELVKERCLGAKNFYKGKPLYCIANVELLPSECYVGLLEMLRNLQEEPVSRFLLALVCRGTNSHPIIDELNKFKTTIAPATDSFVRSIFKAHFGHILTLTSDLAGLGKSCKVIKDAHRKRKQVAILHVSGCARKGHLIERLRTLKVRSFHVLHVDIGTVDDPKALDTFLFEILILGYASVGRTCVALKTNHVYLEIANTVNDTLRNSLQTAMLFSREHKNWQNFDDFIVSKEIHSGIQIVCRYFDYLENGYLDQRDVHLDESKLLSTKKCRRLLQKHLSAKVDMSFPVVMASLDVLADQLKKMSCSPFFRISRLRDMIGNKSEQSVKSSLVKEMINSTREFASRSVSSCRATQSSTILPDTEHLSSESSQEGDIATSVTQRIKGMIRWEDSNHHMFVFHCQNVQTLSLLYRDRNKVPDNIKILFQSQMNKELQDFKSFSQDELQDLLQRIARNNPLPLPRKRLREMASEYALTPDNLLKMVLVMLRINANVPVVIMGETGCGKTSLVRYLASICEVKFDVMNIHAGVSEEEIIDRVQTNCLSANNSLHTEQWLFLDEINTSESIGIMTEIICHHKCLGKSLPPNMIVMGACNPYKLRSTKDIATAGLTMKSKSDELSRLVYRVLPLPEMMVDYVWDFGSLNENDEKLYIQRMVDGLFEDAKLQTLFSDMLSVSQSFVRQKEESAYVVSLRDVYRCRILTKWFIEVLAKKSPLTPYTSDCSSIIRAMILALAHCYHSRFHHKDLRADYRNVLRAKLKDHGIPSFELNQDKVADIINEEQKDFIYRMELPDGTACNTALMENVFVIIVCIYNRLPVFVVGKPGCSKSLAMQVIRSNLRGKDSKDTFFKMLPQLYCVSFQGSESSTSDGIIKVFAKAGNYQKSNNADDVLSVVILDEIGLAEVSRFNPLKVLHNLLEPKGEMRPHVAVVGLSNWSLDASKMNRAIHLSRTDMDEDELYKTATAISESFTKKCKVQSLSEQDSLLNAIESNEDTHDVDDVISLDETLKGISKSYHNYSEKLRFKNFHGLRDYYALVKYVAGTFSPNRMFGTTVQQSRHEENLKPTTVVKYGLERNFGGLPSESTTLYEIFNSHFHFDSKERRNVLALITENVDDRIARHLMLITSGDSALGILEQQLSITDRGRKEIIFGSQFEDDLTDDYNYRILSRIILCMEEGIILILKDLDNIYGSLYDMLNQNYTIIGNKKNCRVALGAYSNPICQVAESFRCIVLMDESNLESCDPPFLNRFEKQYLRFSDILNTEETCLVQHLQTWLKGLRDIQDRSYDFTDVIPIYSENLLPSLVLKTEREFERADKNHFSFLTSACKRKLMWLLKPEAVIRLKRATSTNTTVEADDIKNVFFELPLHCGLEDLISSQLTDACSKPDEKGILTIIFTRSNMHVNLHRCISNKNVQTDKLGAFKSEKQVSAKIQHFWSNNTKANILLVQCSAVDDEKHIMLTKSIIERYRTSYYSEYREKKHVYLIIHMSTNKGFSKVVSQINFMSDWSLVMLDSLEFPQKALPKLCNMDILQAIESKRPLDKCLTSLLFWSFTRIKYSPLGRDVKSIRAILTKMKDSSELLQFLDEEIWRIVSEMETNERDWQIKVACDLQALRNSPNFVDALEQHIIKVIKIPLTKLIFCMEENGILDSYFIEDEVSEERKQFLAKLLHDEQTFSLAKIPDETGPECYSCETADCVLRMPFSKIIYSRVESQKEEFMEEMSVLKGKFDVDRNEDLPPDVYADLQVKQEKRVLLNAPDWMKYCYETCEKDYIHDFSSLSSVNICSGMHRKKRALYMEWIVSQKSDLSQKSILGVSVRLHTSFWMNISLFRSEMQLLAICEKVHLDEHVLDNMLQYSGLQSQRQRSNAEKETTYERVDILWESPLPQHDLEHDVVMAANESETDAETVQETQYSSEVYVLSAEDYLIQDICKAMVPTEATINRYAGISSWQRTVNAILALAAKVSTESKLLFSLRVCNEIASYIIIPLRIDTANMYPLGSLLSNKTIELDSEEIFGTVVNIISAGLKMETNSYRVFASYLVRCISTNTETDVLRYFFEYALNNKIPEEMIHHFRAPLYLATDLESNAVEENKLLPYFLLEGVSESDLGTAKDDKSEDESDSVSCSEEGNLLHTFDEFLNNLAKKNRYDDPFVLLIVDLLVDIFENTLRIVVCNNDSSDRFRTVFDCHKILLDGEFGLRFVSALAYIKSFLSLLGEESMWDYDKNRGYWKAVNVILSDVKTDHISFSLLSHFIKSISKGLTIPQLKVHIEAKKENHEFFGALKWTSSYSHFSFDGNPFCRFDEEAEHRQCDLCNPNKGIAKAKEKLVSFISNSEYNAQGLQRLLCFVLNEFHLSETFESETKDTVHGVLLHFVQEVENQKCSWHSVLKFLCGAESFKHHAFDLQMDSKYLNYSVQFVLLHFFILLWSHNSCEGKEKTSVFMRCLESPRTLKNCQLPGFLDTTSDSGTKINLNAGLATCNCGSRIVFHFGAAETTAEMECVFCSETLVYEKAAPVRTGKSAGERHLLWKFDDIPKDQIEVRGLHPFTFHFLQFIVKGCILGSLAFGLSTIDDAKNLVGDEFHISYLLDNITKHWNQLQKQLRLDDCTLGTLLRVIILETREHFIKHHSHPFTEELRSELEKDIEKQIQQMLQKRSQSVKSKICQHHKLHGVKDDSFENILYENDNVHVPERKTTHSLLFRIKNKPTKENFISELGWRKAEFPFLCLILQFERKLGLPQHIHSIIQWHVTAVASVNYILKKHECLEMTVQDFIFLNQKKKDMVKKRFDSFTQAWDELCSFFKGTEMGTAMKHIHTATKMKDCLIYNQETIIYKVLKILVSIQNQFLDETLLIANVSEALNFLSVKENVFVFPCVHITEIRKEDLVHFQCKSDTWDKILRDESESRLEYGCGTEAIYDFPSIEKRLAMKVLTGVSYIDFRYNIPNIIFADELYINYAGLLLELKRHVEQKPLTPEIVNSIQAKKNDDPRMVKELLSHLGILMTLLKKTGGDPDVPLVHYVSKWGNILNHEFPRALLPNPETSVKLCHIIGLNELLEEICSETVLDALEKEYTERLDDVAMKHILELLRDVQTAGTLLKALKRFMYRGIFSQTADADRPVSGYLNDNSFWPDGCKQKNIIKIGAKEESIQSLLPDYLMVRHVQSLIKQIETEIEKKEKETVLMSEVATDFKKAKYRKRPQNKATAKRARAKNFREY